MKNKISRAEVVRRINALGIFNGGALEVKTLYKTGRCFGHACKIPYQSKAVWNLIDPWGDVSFTKDGVRVQIFCREGRAKAASHINVCATIHLPSESRLAASVKIAKEMNAIFNLETVFSAAQTRIAGKVVAGKILPLR